MGIPICQPQHILSTNQHSCHHYCLPFLLLPPINIAPPSPLTPHHLSQEGSQPRQVSHISPDYSCLLCASYPQSSHLVGVQKVPNGCWFWTQGVCHSMDVLGPVWSSPIPASSDYVDPIYPPAYIFARKIILMVVYRQEADCVIPWK